MSTYRAAQTFRLRCTKTLKGAYEDDHSKLREKSYIF